MKASISWLKDYVAIGIPAEKLAHRLTMAGMEVEKIMASGADRVFELEITPNRPDCLNMVGLARETAAVLNKALKSPKIPKVRMPRTPCDITVLDRQGCPRYVGTVLTGVRVCPSPTWLQQRLMSVGLRPINNVVDITNFCLMETGQPLHAFDYDKLCGNKIVVRRARPGEKIVTLDGAEKTLDESVLVIADAERPVAVAGIMGGENTQVTEGTTNILLESAYFDPVMIRRSSRLLGLASDSSYRFERKVDMPMVRAGALRALGLIQELAGGRVERYRDVFVAGKEKAAPKIPVNLERVRSFLGAPLTAARCRTILKKLGFRVTVKNKEEFVVVPPSFRGDVKQLVDVIEEIARIIGYDHLPMSLPQIKVGRLPEYPIRAVKTKVAEILKGLGLHETITYSLTGYEGLDKTRVPRDGAVPILNPLTQDQAILRPSMLPGLLGAVRLNFNRQETDLRFFETGKTYLPTGEKDVLAVMITGARGRDWRALKAEPADFYDMKGILEGLFKAFCLKDVRFEAGAAEFFSPGQAAVISLGDRRLGMMGRVHADVLKNWDIRDEGIFYASIDMALLTSGTEAAPQYTPVPEYPSVTRDVSLAVGKDAAYREVLALAREIGGPLLKDIRFVEQYLGDKIPDGARGLVFSMTYRSDERTLTEEEVNRCHQSILDAFVNKLAAVIR